MCRKPFEYYIYIIFMKVCVTINCIVDHYLVINTIVQIKKQNKTYLIFNKTKLIRHIMNNKKDLKKSHSNYTMYVRLDQWIRS